MKRPGTFGADGCRFIQSAAQEIEIEQHQPGDEAVSCETFLQRRFHYVAVQQLGLLKPAESFQEPRFDGTNSQLFLGFVLELLKQRPALIKGPERFRSPAELDEAFQGSAFQLHLQPALGFIGYAESLLGKDERPRRVELDEGIRLLEQRLCE